MINPNNQLDFTGSGGNGGGHAWAARIILFMDLVYWLVD